MGALGELLLNCVEAFSNPAQKRSLRLAACCCIYRKGLRRKLGGLVNFSARCRVIDGTEQLTRCGIERLNRCTRERATLTADERLSGEGHVLDSEIKLKLKWCARDSNSRSMCLCEFEGCTCGGQLFADDFELWWAHAC